MGIPAPQDFPLRRLAAVVASVGASQVVLLTLIPIISSACRLSIASIGSLVALGTFCFMLAGPVWGEVSDRHGRRLVVLCGLAVAWLAQLMFISVLLLMAAARLDHAGGILWLSISRVLYGLSAAGVYPACQAWAVDNRPEMERLYTLSTLSASANLGRVLGPVLALPALGLATLSGMQLWPLAWLLILPLVAWLLAASIPAGQKRPVPANAPARSRPVLAPLFGVALLSTAAIGQMQVMLGPVLTDYYGMTALQASSGSALLLLAVAVVSALVQVFIVRRLRAPGPGLVAGAVLMLMGGLLFWPGLGEWLALAALFIFVAGVAFVVPGYTALASRQAGGRQGRVFALLALMHTGGYTLGFAAGGWAYTWGYPLPGLLLVISLMFVAVLLVLRSDSSRGFSTMAGESA